MENYLNGIHHLATTVIGFGKDMGNGVWRVSDQLSHGRHCKSVSPN